MTITGKQELECELYTAESRKNFLSRLFAEKEKKEKLTAEEKKVLKEAEDNFKAKRKAMDDYIEAEKKGEKG